MSRAILFVSQGRQEPRGFKEGDYAALSESLTETKVRLPMRPFSYCLIPNHSGVDLGLVGNHRGR